MISVLSDFNYIVFSTLNFDIIVKRMLVSCLHIYTYLVAPFISTESDSLIWKINEIVSSSLLMYIYIRNSETTIYPLYPTPLPHIIRISYSCFYLRKWRRTKNIIIIIRCTMGPYIEGIDSIIYLFLKTHFLYLSFSFSFFIHSFLLGMFRDIYIYIESMQSSENPT